MHRLANEEYRDDSGTDAAFDELVCRLVGQLEAGDRVDISSVAAEYPVYAERLRQVLPALQAMVAFGGESKLAASRSGNGVAEHSAGPAPAILGEFRIGREIGRGGMGVVYEAEQLSLGRRVALKVLPFAALLDRQQLARFKNEARAAATLDHPNIVAVHSVGSERGVNFYAMQYIDGRSMAEVIAELRRARRPESNESAATQNLSGVTKAIVAGDFAPKRVAANGRLATTAKSSLPKAISDTIAGDTKRDLQAGISTWPGTQSREYFRTVADLGIQASEAIDHAHSHGVLHRDVKPGNLLIDDTGKLWVTDFGLARIEAEAGLTMTGDLLGTLRYMSPEQALAKRVVVDHRSDIYSLGATLYELLTLQPAYAGGDRQEVLRQIAFEEPRRPRQIDRRIPVDLETIIAKAMEKNPADRYATAREMADDFRRFLASEPIRAKPAPLVQRIAKWSRRHVAVVWSAAGALLLSTIVLLVASLQVGKWYREAERQREFASSQLEEVQRQQEAVRAAERKELQARTEIERNKYAKDMMTADQLVERGQVAALHALLDTYLPQSGAADLRGWEWYYYLAKLHEEQQTLYGHVGAVEAIAWSPKGDYVATGGKDGRLNLWDFESGRALRTLTENEDGFLALDWSPDGGQIATGHENNRLRIWDISTISAERTISSYGWYHPIDWSPDGAHVATVQHEGRDGDWVLKIWNAENWKEIKSFRAKVKICVAWSPDGQRIAYLAGVSDDRNSKLKRSEIRIWDLLEEQHLSPTFWHPDDLYAIAWSPAGDKLATAGTNGTILWNTATGKQFRELPSKSPIAEQTIAWHPSTETLAVANPDGSVSVWDTETVVELRRFLTPDGVTRICWSPDGKYLASVGDAGIIKIWRVDESDSAFGVSAGTRYVAWSPDGSQVATANSDGAVKLVSIAEGRSRALPSYEKKPDIIVWSPDGKLVAIGGGAGYISICDVVAGNELSRLPIDGNASELAWMRDRSTLVVITQPKDALSIWNIFERRMIAQLDGQRQVIATTPLNDQLVVGSDRCEIVDPASGKSMLPIAIPAEVQPPIRISAAAWSPDATLIAAAANNLVWLVDSATGGTVRVLRGHQESRVRCAVWRPDGEQLATASPTEVVIWNASTGQPVSSISGQFGNKPDVVWYPDGKTIVVFSGLDFSAVFDATKGYEFAGSAEFDFDRAHRLAAAGDLERAVSLLKQLANEHPENQQYAEAWRRHATHAHLVTAQQYEDKKEWQHAVAELTKAIELSSNNRNALFRRCHILRSQLKETERALSTAARLVQIAPDWPEAWNLRGCCHSDLKQYGESLSDFNQALKLDPDDAQLIYNRGKTLLRLGRYDEALNDLNTAITKTPENWHSLNWAAWLLATAPEDEFRDGRRAIELATKACEMTEFKNAIIVDTLAAAYAEAGDFEKAVEWQQKAIELTNESDAVSGGYIKRLEAFQRREPWREE
jgi:WD40 repeat protein/serine/threonine protein kinase/tetratricopeptide (TPR) repeat protein